MIYRAHLTRPPRHILYLALLLVLLLAGCNWRQEPTPTPAATTALGAIAATSATRSAAPAAVAATSTPAPTPTPLSGSVVLWHSWAQADADALAAILAQLQSQMPGVTVETLFVAPADLLPAYADAVAAGSGPDMVLAPNWWLNDLVQAAAVAPLDALVAPAALDGYWPAALDSLRSQGTLYGLPVNYHLVSLYVNQSLLPAEGIATSTEALLAQARAAPQTGAGLYATLFHLYGWLPAYGAQLLDASGRVTLDQGGGAADYLSWLAALNNTPGSYVNADYGMLLDRFKKGEFAYFVDGPWSLRELRDALGENLTVATLPAGPAGPAQPWLYADGLFFNPHLDDTRRPLVLAVGEALTSAQSGAILAQTAGLLPANRAADLGSDALLAGFAAQAANALAMPTTPEMTEVWAYGGDMLLKALTGVAPPPAIVSETAALINEANGK